MTRKLYISFDCEGPFGMNDFIHKSNDLKKYEYLDQAIYFLHKFHNKEEIPASCGILGMTLLENRNQLKEYTKKYENIKLDEKSLLNRINKDKKFSKLIDDNPNLFFKGKLLKENKNNNLNFIKYCSHTFSHLHFTEMELPISVYDTEISISLDILNASFIKSQLCNSIILPRNQHDKYLLDICKKYKFKSIRTSSKLKLYSENNNDNLLKRFIFKILRKYDQNSFIFNKTLQLLNDYNYYDPIKESINYIDSGVFIPFPKNAKKIKPYINHIKRYVLNCKKFNTDISLWFHPHNLLNNISICEDYYKELIFLIIELTRNTHEIRFLDE